LRHAWFSFACQRGTIRDRRRQWRPCLYRTFLWLLWGLCIVPALAPADPVPDRSVWTLPDVPFPAANPFSSEKALLGKKLFFDPRLSGYGSLSCASCHNPGLNWCDGLQSASAMTRFPLGRHTPTLLNVAYYSSLFWDGRATTLEEQARKHLLSPGVMLGGTETEIVRRISRFPGYRQAFRQIFGKSAVSLDSIVAAIATFERTIISRNSPFDRWLAGDRNAISASAKNGFALFTGKAQCVKCHSGPVFSDSEFHNTGLNSIDPGRFEVSKKNSDRNRFKTPGLRQVADTAPYMHDGSKPTLTSVIEFYVRGGDRPDEANELQPLNLSLNEKQDLIAFLRSLSGQTSPVTIPVLPQQKSVRQSIRWSTDPADMTSIGSRRQHRYRAVADTFNTFYQGPGIER